MVEEFGSEGGCYEIIKDHDRDFGDRADHSVRGSRRRLPALNCELMSPSLNATGVIRVIFYWRRRHCVSGQLLPS